MSDEGYHPSVDLRLVVILTWVLGAIVLFCLVKEVFFDEKPTTDQRPAAEARP